MIQTINSDHRTKSKIKHYLFIILFLQKDPKSHRNKYILYHNSQSIIKKKTNFQKSVVKPYVKQISCFNNITFAQVLLCFCSIVTFFVAASVLFFSND